MHAAALHTKLLSPRPLHRGSIMVKATGFASMSDEYNRLGVNEYYTLHAEDYRNVHFPEIISAVDTLMQHVMSVGEYGRELRVLDLACGSGEATLAIESWMASNPAVRPRTLTLDAADPYTGPAFKHRTGRSAEEFSFEDVAAGYLSERSREYDLCICSFAMHLLQEKSHLWRTLSALATSCELLAILSPHKKPEVAPNTGWQLETEVVVQRVRVRLFQSSLFWQHHQIRQSETSVL